MKKKNTYLFARLFIKLAIILAVLVVLGGIGLAINQFQSMQTALAGVRFFPSPGLQNAAVNLEKSYLGTNKRILRSLDIEEFPPSISLVDFPQSLTAISSANEHEKAVLYSKLASETLNSVEQIKNFHISEFVKSLAALQQTLMENAARLRAQYTPSTAAGTQVQNQQPASTQQTMQPARSSFRIYADHPESDEQRLAQIKMVKEFLEYLRSQSKREESIDQIRRASIYLARAESLLDLLDKSSDTPQLQTETTQEGSDRQENETLVAKSEKMAADVGKVIEIIQAQVYENWTVELQAQELSELAQSEINKAATAANSAKQIRNAGLREISVSLISALAAAFFIMVIADFLRAFLNLSNNSDMLVENAGANP
jgi:hypothetical protein